MLIEMNETYIFVTDSETVRVDVFCIENKVFVSKFIFRNKLLLKIAVLGLKTSSNTARLIIVEFLVYH